jgi:ribose transport system ATP-binding protein
MYRVELQNITKSFGGISALKNVSFQMKPGEIHALVGENGAGKSTLMKILSGAYLKDSGRIFINDNQVDIKSTHDSKKLGIGIIYQEFSLIPDLSVAENAFFQPARFPGVMEKPEKNAAKC